MEKKLPKGWVETEFGNIISLIKNGGNFKQEDLQSENYYPVSRIETIWNEEIDLNRVKYAEITHSDLAKYLLKIGDILFSHINSDRHLGKTAIYKNDVQLIHGVNLLLLRTETGVMPDYVNYYLRNYRFKGGFLEIAQRSVNQSSINQKKLSSIPFSLPPLPEQERIVAKLDKLFAQHEKIKKALNRIPQLLKAFRQQVLTQAVTGKLTEQWREGKGLEWRIEKVRDVTNYNPRYSWDDQTCLSFVEMANLPIRLFSPLKSIKRKFIDVKKGYRRFSNSDVLLAKITPCFENGKSAVADGLLNGIGCGSSEYYVFRCKEGLLPYFLLFHFKRTVFLVEGADNMNGAVGQQRVTQEFVLNYEISIPPPQEQQEIVHRVESLFTKADAIEARYHILKAKIDNLPQALLYKAFKGELVPQLPSDGDAKDLLEEILTLKKEVKRSKKK